MQRLLSNAVWDSDLIRDDLRTYIMEQLGTHKAILVIDERSFPKRGSKSASFWATRRPKGIRSSTVTSIFPSTGQQTPSGVKRRASLHRLASRPNRNLRCR